MDYYNKMAEDGKQAIWDREHAKTITIIGSTSYQEKMRIHKAALEAEGHTVLMPAFDNHAGKDELLTKYANKK